MRRWLLAAGAIALIAGHGVVLYFAWSHLAISATAVAGVVILIALKHLGLLGPLYALLRRRPGPCVR
jgi:uncharacterized membrane protein